MTPLPTLEELVRHPERINALLQAIDEQARLNNCYENGLPTYDDGQMSILREIVLRWALGD